MKIYGSAAEAAEILRRGGFDDGRADAVREIVRAVKERGDEALFEYCEKFDGARPDADSVCVSEEETERAYAAVDAKLLGSLRKAVVDGDVVNGTLMAGQIAGLVKREQTCREMIEEMMEQAEALLKR